MKMYNKIKGITLISLIISIIILIILSGISVNFILGENGIFSMAMRAKDTTQTATEEETLKMQLLAMQMNDNIKKVGKPLYDRNLDNSSIWDIIIQNKENITYGTGWNYLEKGTEIEGYGKSKYDWVINYETGKMVQLKAGEYTEWSYEKVGTITDGLLFNLDSANVSLDKSSWGNNTTLYYYDAQKYDTIEKRKAAFEEQRKEKEMVEDSNGYDRQIAENVRDYIEETTNAFQFNGNNYIEYREKEGNTLDFSNGLTLTFYGKIKGNTSTFRENDNYCPFFSLWSGRFIDMSYTRLGYINRNKLYWHYVFIILSWL